MLLVNVNYYALLGVGMQVDQWLCEWSGLGFFTVGFTCNDVSRSWLLYQVELIINGWWFFVTGVDVFLQVNICCCMFMSLLYCKYLFCSYAELHWIMGTCLNSVLFWCRFWGWIMDLTSTYPDFIRFVIQPKVSSRYGTESWLHPMYCVAFIILVNWVVNSAFPWTNTAMLGWL